MLLIERLNRRASDRTKYFKEVLVTDSTGNVHSFYSYNYSPSGIALISQQNMAVGDVYELKFIITDERGSSHHQVNAEVVQEHCVGALHVAGLKFEQELKLH